jgi:hypothetical protein
MRRQMLDPVGSLSVSESLSRLGAIQAQSIRRLRSPSIRDATIRPGDLALLPMGRSSGVRLPGCHTT